MNNYSPFEAELADIVPDDLHALTTVSEGWYVEYKRELPTAKAIAKSVSAFANTYGGWLFIGIEEKSKQDPVAGAFPGIESSQVDAALQRIRHAIGEGLSSTPHVETKVLHGPSSTVNLPLGSAVICVRVPWGVNAPFVHSSGQVYRRVADGSEPKPESDRHLLSQLWHRSDQTRRDYRKWVRRDPEFSKDEAKVPYLRVLLVPDLWQDREPRLDLTLRQARLLFNRPDVVLSNSPFHSTHLTSGGFVARQTLNNDPGALTLTWVLRFDLTSEVYVPLPLYDGAAGNALMNLQGYEHSREYCELLSQRQHKHVRIIDLNLLFRLVAGIVEQNEFILDHAGWNEDYHAKCRLLNVWRTVPFLDTAEFVGDCRENGLPMCLTDIITTPPGLEPDTFREISRNVDGSSDVLKMFQRTLQLFIPIAQAFGVPIVLDEGEVMDLEALYHAGERALENQRIRIDGGDPI